ncbi:MAG: hypothetical protein IPM48_06300 [Saprospiraceae bacterium]|nr:hypothetical protein [Saprospiraceae bacterium]
MQKFIDSKLVLISFVLISSCCIEGIQDCGECTPPKHYESQNAISWVEDVDMPSELNYYNQRNPSNTFRLIRRNASYDTCVGDPGCCTVFRGRLSYLTGEKDGQVFEFVTESLRDVVNFTIINDKRDSSFFCRLYADTLVAVPRTGWRTSIYPVLYDNMNTLVLSLIDPTDTSAVDGLTALDWIKGIGPVRIRWTDGSDYILD